MVTTPPTHRQGDPAASLPRPRGDTALCLSTRTLAWLVPRPLDLAVVESVWDTLAELEAAGHCPRLVAAMRFVLIHPSRPERVAAAPAAGQVGAVCGAGADFPAWCGVKSAASC